MSGMKTDKKVTASNRSMLNTTIETETLNAFKEYCKECGYRMNMILESFMRQFVAGEFVLKIGKANKLNVEVTDEAEN